MCPKRNKKQAAPFCKQDYKSVLIISKFMRQVEQSTKIIHQGYRVK